MNLGTSKIKRNYIVTHCVKCGRGSVDILIHEHRRNATEVNGKYCLNERLLFCLVDKDVMERKDQYFSCHQKLIEKANFILEIKYVMT